MELGPKSYTAHELRSMSLVDQKDMDTIEGL